MTSNSLEHPAAASPFAALDPRAAAAARVAAAAAWAVAAILVALHAIKPELDPSWRFLSEYSIGPHGWIMTAGFMIWAAGCVALAVALRREVGTLRGRAGVALLLIVAAALVVAGIFPQDPVTAKPDELTTAGSVHAAASMVGIPGLPIAAMLITSALWRTSQGWRPHRTTIMTAAHATWISLVVMILYLLWAVPRAGGFNSAVWAGWMNRLVVATYLAWQVVIARRLIGKHGAA